MDAEYGYWEDVFSSAWHGLDAAATPDFYKVLQRYFEPGRYYHNADHLAWCIFEWDRLRAPTSSFGYQSHIFTPHFAKVLIALVYHDAVYRIGASDNETLSADLFMNDARDYAMKPEDVEEIREAILSTKDHIPRNEVAKHVCDIDLSVLSAPWQVYNQYRIGIRNEYFAMVPNGTHEQYVKARRKFLVAMSKKLEYHTPEFQGHHYRALRNLNHDLTTTK
jgi:predicted metal-dependent HD superfamily phosphohydrolase